MLKKQYDLSFSLSSKLLPKKDILMGDQLYQKYLEKLCLEVEFSLENASQDSACCFILSMITAPYETKKRT